MLILNYEFISGARILPAVEEGLMLLSDNSLDFHAIIVSISLVDILKILEISWDIKC